VHKAGPGHRKGATRGASLSTAGTAQTGCPCTHICPRSQHMPTLVCYLPVQCILSQARFLLRHDDASRRLKSPNLKHQGCCQGPLCHCQSYQRSLCLADYPSLHCPPYTQKTCSRSPTQSLPAQHGVCEFHIDPRPLSAARRYARPPRQRNSTRFAVQHASSKNVDQCLDRLKQDPNSEHKAHGSQPATGHVGSNRRHRIQGALTRRHPQGLVWLRRLERGDAAPESRLSHQSGRQDAAIEADERSRVAAGGRNRAVPCSDRGGYARPPTCLSCKESRTRQQGRHSGRAQADQHQHRYD
jgi:hypothetical protein